MAVTFDGTDDGIVTAVDAAMDLTAGFSVGAWVYATGWGQGNIGRILEHCDDGGFTKGWSLYAQSSNALIAFGGYGGSTVSSTASAFALNTAYHVAVVVSADGNLATIYLNGVSVGSGDPNLISDVTAPLLIGQRNDSNRTWAGRISDVWYYADTLSVGDVTEIMKHRRLPHRFFNTNLKLYLPLMGPTAAAVNTAHWGCKDLSGNGNSVASVASAPVWADDPLAPQSWVDGWFGGARAVAAGEPPASSIAAIAAYYRRLAGGA